MSALLFNGTTDNATCSSAVSTFPSGCSILALIRQDATQVIGNVFSEDTGSVAWLYLECQVLSGIRCIQFRRAVSTTDQRLRSNISTTHNRAPFGEWGWVGVACPAPTSGAGKLYTSHPGGTGSVWAPISEVTGGYNVQNTGVGTLSLTPTASAIGDIAIGVGSDNFDGSIAVVYVWDRELSREELRAAQFGRPPRNGLVGEYYPGKDGSSTILDYSGQGNTFTPSSPTLTAGPPIATPFGIQTGLPYVVAAVAAESLLIVNKFIRRLPHLRM